MALCQLLSLLLVVLATANAQWRGDIGYQRDRGGWQVRGGASYDFAKGRGSFGTHGYYDSTGNYGARATLSYRWGRKRRSLMNGDELRQMCQECVTVETITSPEKLQEYAEIHKVDFSMIAKLKNIYQGTKERILNFDIKEILEQPPTDLNISDAKVFNIFAEKKSCALTCLKDFVQDDYIVTGAMFHGRLIIDDKLILFHPGLPEPSEEVPSDEDETEAPPLTEQEVIRDREY